MPTHYPEHEKLENVGDLSQAIGEFLEWLSWERNISLCEVDDSGMTQTLCFIEVNFRRVCVESDAPTYLPVSYPVNSLLAEFFGIDLKKIDEEKDQMLAEIRAANEMS